MVNTHWQAVITVRLQQIRQGKVQSQDKALILILLIILLLIMDIIIMMDIIII